MVMEIQKLCGLIFFLRGLDTIQGGRKLFKIGQAKVNPELYSIKCVGSQ